MAALDGDACTLVSLEAERAALMCGGDAAGWLVVTLQSGECPGEEVVDLAKATQAMETFRQTAELDNQLAWRVG